MAEQPRAPEPISPEISRITSTVDSILKTDFSKLEEKDIILQVQKTGKIKKGDANFMVTDEKGQNTPLTQYLDQNLHTLAATLPETKQQELIEQGILKKEGERLVFTDKVKSEDRLNFISALFKHYKEDGFDKLSVQLEANGLNVGDTLTTLQILSLDYAEKALGEYGKTQEIEETKTGRKTILKKSARGRLQISGAFSPDEKGLELSLMRGSLFRVDRKSTAINNEGKEVGFGKLELELARAAKAGNYDRFSEITGRFLDLSQNDAKAREDITKRLRITIQRKISDQKSSLSEEDKINLQAILPNLTNPANFEEAIKTVFSFDAWQVGTKDADPAKRNESFRNLYSGFYEWGQIMFGREGYGRLQEVDLKMAVGIQDALLPPDVRQKRILLEERVRQIKQGILGDQANPDLNHVLSKLVSIDDEYKDAVHDLLEERQKEQKAILVAFGVRYEGATPEGTPAVAEADIDDATRELATQIKNQFTTIRGKSVLGANRDATLAILTNLGVNLTSDQQNKLREHLSADSIINPDKTSGLISSDQILAEMGIYKTAPNYQNIKAVVKDGRRVASSLVSLGKKETDDVYSKAESLKMGGGTLFDMGLKGVEYLYRQGVEEKTGAEETVTIKHEVKTPPTVTLPDSVSTYEIDESGDLLLDGLLQGSKKPIPPEPPEVILTERTGAQPAGEPIDTTEQAPAAAPNTEPTETLVAAETPVETPEAGVEAPTVTTPTGTVRVDASIAAPATVPVTQLTPEEASAQPIQPAIFTRTPEPTTTSTSPAEKVVTTPETEKGSRKIEVWQGKENKSQVFNEGQYSVPFNLKNGTQHNSLRIRVEPNANGQPRVIFIDDVRQKQPGDVDIQRFFNKKTNSYELKINKRIIDLSEGPIEIQKTGDVSVLIVGFNRDTQEVLLYKKIGDEKVEFKVPKEFALPEKKVESLAPQVEGEQVVPEHVPVTTPQPPATNAPPSDGPPTGEPAAPPLGQQVETAGYQPVETESVVAESALTSPPEAGAQVLAASEVSVPAIDRAAVEKQVLDFTEGINTPLGEFVQAQLEYVRKQNELEEFVRANNTSSPELEEKVRQKKALADEKWATAKEKYANNLAQIDKDRNDIFFSLQTQADDMIGNENNRINGNYTPETAAKIQFINEFLDILYEKGSALLREIPLEPEIPSPTSVSAPQPPATNAPPFDQPSAVAPQQTPTAAAPPTEKPTTDEPVESAPPDESARDEAVGQPTADQAQVEQRGRFHKVLAKLRERIGRGTPATQTAEAGIQTPTEQQRKLERLLKNGVKSEADLGLILAQRMAELGFTDLNRDPFAIERMIPIRSFYKVLKNPEETDAERQIYIDDPIHLRIMGDVLLSWPRVIQTQAQIPPNLRDRANAVYNYLCSQKVLTKNNKNLADLLTILFADPQLPQEVKNRNQKIVEFVIKINAGGKYNPSDEVKDTVRSFLATLRTVDHSSTLVKGITPEQPPLTPDLSAQKVEPKPAAVPSPVQAPTAEAPQPLTALTADRTAEADERPLSQEEIDELLAKLEADNLQRNHAIAKIKEYLDGLNIPDRDKRIEQIDDALLSDELEAIATALTTAESMLPESLAHTGATQEEIQTAEINLNTTRLLISNNFIPQISDQNRDIIAKYLYPMMKNAGYDFALLSSESLVSIPNFGYWKTVAVTLRNLLI